MAVWVGVVGVSRQRAGWLGPGRSVVGRQWSVTTWRQMGRAHAQRLHHRVRPNNQAPRHYLSVCLPACGWQRQSTTAKQLANHCNSIHCAQKTGPTTHVEIHLTKQIELSYDQLIAASLIGQNAVMWHSSLSNAARVTVDSSILQSRDGSILQIFIKISNMMILGWKCRTATYSTLGSSYCAPSV